MANGALIDKDDAATVAVIIYLVTALLDIAAVFTTFFFRKLFQKSSLSRVITTIHAYLVFNSLIYMITYRADSGTFRCNLFAFVADVCQLSVMAWITVLGIKVTIFVRPKSIVGSFKSTFWDDVALQKKGQLFVFIFSCILSASKWAKYDMVSISPWCWCNPAEASRAVYIGTSFAFFYGPVGVGVLLNAYLTISALQIVRHMKVNDSIKRRFTYLLGYPVVLTCWAACSWISFITSSSSTTLFGPITLIFESFWIIWYPIIFFLVFRSARRAWGVYFAELWATKNFMAASSASHNWVNDMAKATEMGIQQGMEEAGASAKPISRSMSPRHMSDIPDIMNELAMVDGDMNVQIQVESPMQEMNQRRTIDGNRSTLDRQTIVAVQEDVSRGKDDRRGRNVNVIEVQILQNS